MDYKIPTMMSIPEVARTGILPEFAIRNMVKAGEIPAIYSGGKAFINFDNLCKKLSITPFRGFVNKQRNFPPDISSNHLTKNAFCNKI